MNKRLTNEELAQIKQRAVDYEEIPKPLYRTNFRKHDIEFVDSAREDIPKLLAEIERLRREITFIANVDLTKNAVDEEHIAVSVKSWALNVLEGVNHDE